MFVQKVAEKYKVVAKTKWLEQQVSDTEDKLKKFLSSKAKMLKAISDSDLAASEKGAEERKLDSVEKYLRVSIRDLKDAIVWRDKTDTNIDNKKDLELSPAGAKLQMHKIPSFNVLPGVTCPNKKECFGWCYAMGGHPMAWQAASSPARAKQTRSLGLAERDDWVARMNAQLDKLKDGTTFRIHVAGDFYSPEYIKKWIKIADAHPNLKFYAYTKSHQMQGIKALEKRPNVTIRYSLGGTEDDKVDLDKDIHCKVFDSKEDLDNAGYTECGHDSDDRIAADKNTPKLGIVKHGTRKYQPKIVKPHTLAAVSTYPVAHLYDQIDAPHSWSKDETALNSGIGAHQTETQYVKHWKK